MTNKVTGKTPDAKPLNVIVGSSRDSFNEFVLNLLSQMGGLNVAIFKSSEELIDNSNLVENPILTIVDCHEASGSMSEWLQTITSSFAECKCIVVYESNSLVEDELFRKNGANEICHRFYDLEQIENSIAQAIPPGHHFESVPLTLLTPIRMSDLEPDSETKFDIYLHLPTNRKTILLKKSGEIIPKDAIQKFEKLNARVYIKKSHMNDFINYSKTVGSAKGDAKYLSQTEKNLQLSQALYQMTSKILSKKVNNFNEGKELCESIVSLATKSDLLKEYKPQDYGKLLNLYSQESRGVSNDMIHMANYCNIIGQIIGFDLLQRQSLVLAGLLHNIGLAKIGNFELRPEYEVNGENAANFKNYPMQTVNLLKEKKLTLSTETFTAIEHHREKNDGTGFPKGLKGPDISNIGKAIQLVFRFYEMTSISSAKADILTPKTAISFLKQEALGGSSPHEMVMVLDLSKKVTF